MHDLFQIIHRLWIEHPAKPYYIALSGGLDSVVLLYSLRQYFQDKDQIIAIHVNHGISPFSDQWEAHCQHLCQLWQCQLIVKKPDQKILNTGKGLEDAARIMRYHLFQTLLKQEDILLTAHHQNDQIETMLLKLMRGTGLSGISGMSYHNSKDFPFHCIRPFLSVPQSTLEQIAQQHQLSWVQDESNADLSFDRNFIRHQVFPLLKQKWPQCEQSMARFGERAQASYQLLQEYIQEELEKVQSSTAMEGSLIAPLNLPLFFSLNQEKRFHVLQHWIMKAGFRAVYYAHCHEIDKWMRSQKTKNSSFALRNLKLIKMNHYLGIMHHE